jgi:hypothetical protein
MPQYAIFGLDRETSESRHQFYTCKSPAEARKLAAADGIVTERTERVPKRAKRDKVNAAQEKSPGGSGSLATRPARLSHEGCWRLSRKQRWDEPPEA